MMRPSERIIGQKAKHVFQFIAQYGISSKLELKNISGLTSTTLTRILEELTGQGLILAGDFGESTGGRRPILYRVNPSYGYIFGLDISRAHSKLLLCDMQLNIIDFMSWKMDVKMTPLKLLKNVVLEVRRMIAKHSISKDCILGLGIGAVGPLNRNDGVIANPQHFASPGWEYVEVCDFLQSRLGIHTVLDNGANTAILGEYWMDTDTRLEHLLYVHAGVGIRSAIIAAGEVVYGAVDMEGAAGQMIIQCEHEQEGGYGVWESFVSSSTYFGVGLANMLNILHPQKVILGGPLISNNQDYYDNAIRVALNNTYHAPNYDVIFEKSKLGEDAVAIGAAVLIIKQMIS